MRNECASYECPEQLSGISEKKVEAGNDIILAKKTGCCITNVRTGMRIPMRLKPGGHHSSTFRSRQPRNAGTLGYLV